ncbi:DUF2254 domain-containing protein [Aquipuribacter sp. MA13-6]|uniref:DUF2254 domain-containing protein n=1 Tax=unclassified Aquipuribacter TaxID=2635084 RepID=UPI003EEFA1BD
MAVLVRLRETFWLVPGLLCLLAAATAQGLIALDESLDSDSWEGAGTIVYLVGADGSRDLLSAIAGSMLAVASTTFSITIAVLALTSSSYGPRLVRNFMADRGNQLVLGTYVATYLYALLVLRSIRTLDGGDEEPFVPQLAVNGAVLLAVISIGVLVWFIHHISESIQVWTLAKRVHGELRTVVEDLYPEQLGDGPLPPETPGLVATALATTPVTTVRAGRGGYVLRVSTDDLLERATDDDVVIELVVRPGSYVTEQGVLARVHGRVADEEAVTAAVRRYLPLAAARSPFQDVEFATQQLVELAVRALSPGTNDPYTAVNALDDLSDGLAAMARRRMPSPARLDEDGAVRVVAPAVVLTDLVEMLVDAMRAYALDHPDVVMRTVDVLGRVGAGADASTRAHLVEQLELLVAHFERGDPHPHDLARVRARATGTLLDLRGPVAV